MDHKVVSRRRSSKKKREAVRKEIRPVNSYRWSQETLIANKRICYLSREVTLRYQLSKKRLKKRKK